MVRVGIIGLGGMGTCHFGCYETTKGAEVVAVADTDEEKLDTDETTVEINIGRGRTRIDPDKHRIYTDAMDLIEDPDVDLVDITLPTFLHAEHARRALEAGKHVLCEKPMALTPEECEDVLAAASQAEGLFMVAHCVRFTPAYEYLQDAVDSGRLGMLRQLHMWRLSAPPDWSWDGWMLDAERSGGAILDLHIHDADFVHHALGKPTSVMAAGSRGPSGGWDAVGATYMYEGHVAVTAMANFCMPKAFEFEAGFVAAFDRGALRLDNHGLLEINHDGASHPELRAGDGRTEEIDYFVRCIENGEAPAMVTPASSAFSVRLIHAERESIESGRPVSLED